MGLAILWLLMMGEAPSLPPAHMVFTEDAVFPNDRFLHSPMDAVFDGTYLWIAPGGFEVWRIDQSGNFFVIGAKGQGPGEFSQAPIELALGPKQIRIIERYRWHMLTFTRAGQFVERHDFKDNNATFAGDDLYRIHSLAQARQNGHLIHREQDGQPFAPLKQITDLQYHQAQPVLTRHENYIYVIASKGSITAYGPDEKVRFSLNMPLPDLRREPEPHPWADRMVNPNKQGNRKYYRYGTPVLAAASEDDQLWLLLSNEWQADRWARPQEVWLAQLLIGGKTAHIRRHPLPFKPESIRIHNGYVTLCSKRENHLAVYDLTTIANWLETHARVKQDVSIQPHGL